MLVTECLVLGDIGFHLGTIKDDGAHLQPFFLPGNQQDLDKQFTDFSVEPLAKGVDTCLCKGGARDADSLEAVFNNIPVTHHSRSGGKPPRTVATH